MKTRGVVDDPVGNGEGRRDHDHTGPIGGDTPRPSGDVEDIDQALTVSADEFSTIEDGSVTVASRMSQLRFHARGGLGEVFRARDDSLHRDVAVKFIRPKRALDPLSRERFRLEAEITGRLDHPGIVPVYGVGETFDGRDLLVMRFIEGSTLRSAVDQFHQETQGPWHRRRYEFNRLLSHLVAACKTIAYAHARGILHRDIKPDNIMIGRFGETLVVDWGLAMPVERDAQAKASGEETIHLESGGSGDSGSYMAAGTIGFMSPESLEQDQSGVGPRSDVYSLGGTLYYLLTGKRSLSGNPTPELLASIRQSRFPSPRRVNREVPRPLDAVCQRAMSAMPSDRYATPLELARDLEAYIEDEPVSVVQENAFERLRRFARNHRGVVTAALAGLLGIVAVSLVAAVWLNRQKGLEQEARAVAVQAEQESLRLAANFAAQTVAGEIDVRWRVLESIAASPDLRRLIAAAEGRQPDSKEWGEVRRWLSERTRKFEDLHADSWFLVDGHGRQIARVPHDRKTVGVDFSGRDYFHGLGRQMDESDGPFEPIRDSYVSTPHMSAADHHLKIACSAPVWAADDELQSARPIGVIGMSARAGEFRILKRGLGDGQIGVLLDVRAAVIDGKPRAGEVIHHPELTRLQLQDLSRTGSPGRYFLDELVGDLVRLRALREAAFESREDAEAMDRVGGLNLGFLRNYVDPLASDPRSRWSAAMEPVIISGRPAPQRNTGLFVIVEQQAAAGR